MPHRKITDLPVHTPEEHNLVNIASFDTEGITRRIDVWQYTLETEQEAIERVRQIYNDGLKAFIMPVKNV